MASELTPVFQKQVNFAGRNFPLDTAVKWDIMPSYDCFAKEKKQFYIVSVRANTFDQGKPCGFIDLQFKAETLEKANTLIQDLIKNNIKWDAFLNGVTPSLADRTIVLKFADGWAGNIVLEGGSAPSINFASVFTAFHQTAAVLPAGVQVEEIQNSPDSIALRFSPNLDQAALKAKMAETLAKMQNVFADNRVFDSLTKSKDRNFQVKKNDETPVTDIHHIFQNLGSMSGPTYQSNLYSPIFEITETGTTGKNRFNGGGSNNLKEEDIPRILTNHLDVITGKPAKKNQTKIQDDEKELRSS